MAIVFNSRRTEYCWAWETRKAVITRAKRRDPKTGSSIVSLFVEISPRRDWSEFSTSRANARILHDRGLASHWEQKVDADKVPSSNAIESFRNEARSGDVKNVEGNVL